LNWFTLAGVITPYFYKTSYFKDINLHKHFRLEYKLDTLIKFNITLSFYPISCLKRYITEIQNDCVSLHFASVL